MVVAAERAGHLEAPPDLKPEQPDAADQYHIWHSVLAAMQCIHLLMDALFERELANSII